MGLVSFVVRIIYLQTCGPSTPLWGSWSSQRTLVSPTGQRCGRKSVQHRSRCSLKALRATYVLLAQNSRSRRSEYVAEAKLRRLCPEPQAEGVSPSGRCYNLFVFNIARSALWMDLFMSIVEWLVPRHRVIMEGEGLPRKALKSLKMRGFAAKITKEATGRMSKTFPYPYPSSSSVVDSHFLPFGSLGLPSSSGCRQTTPDTPRETSISQSCRSCESCPNKRLRKHDQDPYTFRLPIGQPVSNIDHVSQPLPWFPVFVAGSWQRIEH